MIEERVSLLELRVKRIEDSLLSLIEELRQRTEQMESKINRIETRHESEDILRQERSEW